MKHTSGATQLLLQGLSPESLYRQFSDPWDELTRVQRGSAGLVNSRIRELIINVNPSHILDIGCGLGIRSRLFRDAQLAGGGYHYLALDASETVIARARADSNGISFRVCDFVDVQDYLNRQSFDMIIMSEVTWYVLSNLSEFADVMYRTQKGATFVHSLVTYPAGQQQYGKDFFTNGPEIRTWWKGIDWLDWLEAGDSSHETTNTLSIGLVK